MQISKSLRIVLAFCTITTVLCATETYTPYTSAPLLARLSYESSWGVPGRPGMPIGDICFSVWQDGHYRILRNSKPGPPILIQGNMSMEQLQQLKSWLDTPDFLALAGVRGGLVRKGTENFIAEVPREDKVQRVVLMITDNHPRFPKPVTDIIDWMRKFKDVSATQMQPTGFIDVCPPRRSSLYQPVAELDSSSLCAGIAHKAR